MLPNKLKIKFKGSQTGLIRQGFTYPFIFRIHEGSTSMVASFAIQTRQICFISIYVVLNNSGRISKGAAMNISTSNNHGLFYFYYTCTSVKKINLKRRLVLIQDFFFSFQDKRVLLECMQVIIKAFIFILLPYNKNYQEVETPGVHFLETLEN